MQTCLDLGNSTARCNLIAYCFKVKDPNAMGGECAYGWKAGLDHTPPANLLGPAPAEHMAKLKEYYEKRIRGEPAEPPTDWPPKVAGDADSRRCWVRGNTDAPGRIGSPP